MHSLTAYRYRHNFSVVLRRHIIPHPLALKHFPDTPFSAPYPTFLTISVPLPPFPVVNPFLLPKTYKHPFPHPLTSSPSHLLTLSFSLFTSLIFYPFTFKNSFFSLPFYLFTLLIFPFHPSCSFPLIVKKYLYSVIFIPIYLSCFHKSINFAEV